MYSRDEIRERLAFAIPNWWQDILEMKNIQDRQADEIALFVEEYRKYINGHSPVTAEGKYLAKWEVLYGIPPAIDYSTYDAIAVSGATYNDLATMTYEEIAAAYQPDIEERRSAVMAMMRGNGPITIPKLKEIAATWRNGEVDIERVGGTIRVKFTSTKGVPVNIDYIYETLRKIVPAHLVIEFVFLYNTYKKTASVYPTYNDLKASGYTYEQLKTADIGGS